MLKRCIWLIVLVVSASTLAQEIPLRWTRATDPDIVSTLVRSDPLATAWDPMKTEDVFGGYSSGGAITPAKYCTLQNILIRREDIAGKQSKVSRLIKAYPTPFVETAVPEKFDTGGAWTEITLTGNGFVTAVDLDGDGTLEAPGIHFQWVPSQTDGEVTTYAATVRNLRVVSCTSATFEISAERWAPAARLELEWINPDGGRAKPFELAMTIGAAGPDDGKDPTAPEKPERKDEKPSSTSLSAEKDKAVQ